VTMHHDKFLTTKQIIGTNLSNFFLEWKSTYFGQFLFSLCTSQWYMSYIFVDSSQAVSKYVWYIPLRCVQWKTPDDGQRNCLKHVEFHSRNKVEKLVHLVGFVIRNLLAVYEIRGLTTAFIRFRHLSLFWVKEPVQIRGVCKWSLKW
jgi:hypothetical protein